MKRHLSITALKREMARLRTGIIADRELMREYAGRGEAATARLYSGRVRRQEEELKTCAFTLRNEQRNAKGGR